jgi:flagellar basal-body rod protein FlgC
MKAIAENISNIDATEDQYGNAYKRNKVVIKTNKEEKPVATVVKEKNNAENKVYNPGHPDADSYGFVAVPDISLSQEMADLSLTSTLYEANMAGFSSTKKIIQGLINIGK